MKVKKLLRGLLSLALCASVVNVFGGATVTVHAADDDDEDGIVAKKTATVNEEDGSYTIDLEAFVKGEVVTIEKNVDVVLIVDISNSMAWVPGQASDAQQYNQSKLYAAMQAADTLSDIILKKDDGTPTGNSLSFVTFAGYDEQHHNGTFNYFDSVLTVFQNVTNTTTAKTAFDNVRIRTGGDTGYQISMDGGRTYRDNLGGTNYDYAFNQASGVVDYVRNAYAQDYADDERETFVIFMTDGAPDMYNNYAAKTPSNANRNTRIDNGAPYAIPGGGYTANATNWYQYITTHANPYALQVYNKISEGGKDDAGKMFAVGFDLDHGGFSQWTFTGLPTFLQYMLYNENSGTSDGDKKEIKVETATTAEKLKEIFEGLAEEIGQAAIDLNEQAVMKDIVAKSFTLPDGADKDDISVKVVGWDQANQKWSDTEVYTAEQWKTATGEEIEVAVNGDEVDVTGFNYSDHFLVESTEAGRNADAAKIVVSFKIFAKPESITGSSVVTNGETSGIYDASGKAVTTFTIPNVKFENATYVIDYAKPTTLDYSSILTTVTRIDDPMDKILQGNRVEPEGASSDESFDFSKTYETNYAHVTYENVYDGQTQQTEKFYVIYEPKTTKWDGYDKLFVMGKPNNGDSSIEGGNVWGLMTVVPANNVYYEDTFVTTTGTNGENSGTVGIKYTGAWKEAGTSTNQIENANGGVMGWEETLADDTQYSDGSAHYVDGGSGSASFSFTGTGVDVYSRTNNSTGTIMVQLSGTPDGSDTVVKKNYIISNKAAHGDYYQIPTFTVDNLDYGTYTVKITVTKADKGRLEYYIDGIRVYNPMKPMESEELVQEAYVNELGAVFTEAKKLMQADENGKKIAYMDEDASGNAVEADYGDTEVGRFAPEHEIYIAAGSSVVIGVDDTSKNYYVGLKAPDAPNGSSAVGMEEGSAIVDMTEGEEKTSITINHTTDLYYKVIPASDGTIVIKNTGSTLLALTKIRTTDSANRGVSPDAVNFTYIDSSRAVSALALFATLDYADDENDVLTPEEAEIVKPTEPEEEVIEVPAETEPEVEITELGEEDIEISVAEPEPVVEEKPSTENKSTSLLKRLYQNLFSAISRLFR